MTKQSTNDERMTNVYAYRTHEGASNPMSMTGTSAVVEDVQGKPQRFDLEERTAHFGERVIAFAKKIPRNPVTLPLISQLVRSGTSVGSNYCEADDAVSKKDFRHKIGICKKEVPHPEQEGLQ